MPVHDWKKEDAGLFHAFHGSWITHLYEALMDGILPKGYLALPEQYLDGVNSDTHSFFDEDEHYIAKQRHIVVRDRKERQLVAVIESVSPSNKKARHGVDQFLSKSVELLNKGVNLVIIDVLPPTRACPVSFHNLIWEYRHAVCDYVPPKGRKLSVATYDTHNGLEAFLEPIGIGEAMPPMPLFLLDGTHVELPLEETANRAMRFLPLDE